MRQHCWRIDIAWMIRQHEHRPRQSPELFQPIDSNAISQPQNKANNEPEHLFNYRSHSPLLGILISILCFNIRKKKPHKEGPRVPRNYSTKFLYIRAIQYQKQSHVGLGKPATKRDILRKNAPQSTYNKINPDVAGRLFCRIKVCFFRGDTLYRLAGLHTDPIDVLHLGSSLTSYVSRIVLPGSKDLI